LTKSDPNFCGKHTRGFASSTKSTQLLSFESLRATAMMKSMDMFEVCVMILCNFQIKVEYRYPSIDNSFYWDFQIKPKMAEHI